MNKLISYVNLIKQMYLSIYNFKINIMYTNILIPVNYIRTFVLEF